MEHEPRRIKVTDKRGVSEAPSDADDIALASGVATHAERD
jgi:hypothetical protein